MRYINTRSVVTFILLVFALIVLWTFIAGIGDFGTTAEAEQLDAIVAMIERAAIQCYALEGGFPPNIEYLTSYGIVLNHDRFVYHYDTIGSNVMPSISVTARR